MTVMRWLLDSDPSIRWQVMRDLSDEPDDVVGRRARAGGPAGQAQGQGQRKPGKAAPAGKPTPRTGTERAQMV
jgi:hypothetical protein